MTAVDPDESLISPATGRRGRPAGRVAIALDAEAVAAAGDVAVAADGPVVVERVVPFRRRPARSRHSRRSRWRQGRWWWTAF